MPRPIAGLTAPKTAGQSLRRMIARLTARGWRAILFWHARAHQRRALSELDDRLLDDIGVDRRSARRETVKRFWQD
ncbi:MAG: DUF1127 domain-containing protein [Rhodospirillales bacterium]|nr:DUF1127 domain-containing protein [Rhodospirillales bacterium]